MSFAFRCLFAPAVALVLASGLLASCSSPSATSTPADAAAGTSTPPPPASPFGGKIDSLNGIAGHSFGEPLSAFPKMQLLPPAPGEVTRTYTDEGTTGWFGQHHAQVRTQFYYFLDGKFYRFLALGDPAVLRPEVLYLFGPGQAQGQYQLFWEGSRARAAYVEKAEGFGLEGRLDVLSKPVEAELAARARAKLKAENAQ